MSEEIKKEAQDLVLDLDKLEQVSGGGYLQDLINRIVNSGKVYFPERTGGV